MTTPIAPAVAPTSVADDYLALVLRFPLVRIRDDDHLDAAHSIIDQLAIIGEDDLTPGQMDYLLALGDLTTVYEADILNEMTREVTGLSTLQHLVEERGIDGGDVGQIIGDPEAGPATLRGEREISREDARRLGAHFHLPHDLFLR